MASLKLFFTVAFGYACVILTTTSCIAQNPALLVPGRSIGALRLGESRLKVYKTLGLPSLSFHRTVDTLDNMWFPKTSVKYKTYVSVLFRNDKAVQIEVPLPEGNRQSITVASVEHKYHDLSITALGYDMSKHEGQDGYAKQNSLYEEKTHFQANAVSYYYDAIQEGIAFSLGVQDYFDGSAKFQKIIIHQAGSRLVPPINGRQQRPIDETKNAQQPPEVDSHSSSPNLDYNLLHYRGDVGCLNPNWHHLGGPHMLGFSSSSMRNILGKPGLTFLRPDGLTEEMWLPTHRKYNRDRGGYLEESPETEFAYVAVLFDGGKAIQIETTIVEGGGLNDQQFIEVGRVKKVIPDLVVSAFTHDMSKKFSGVSAKLDNQMQHYQPGHIVFYYDDVQSGVAFSVNLITEFSSAFPNPPTGNIDAVIVHTPGRAVISTSFGQPTNPRR